MEPEINAQHTKGLREHWPRWKRIVLGALSLAAIAAWLAGSVRAPFARELRFATFALVVPALLFGVAEEVLERLGWIDKPT